MANVLVCPLAFNGTTLQACRKDTCAWWNDGECAILTIAKSSVPEEEPEAQYDESKNHW